MTRYVNIDQELYSGWDDVDISDVVIIEHIRGILESEHPKVIHWKLKGHVWIDLKYLLECNPLLRITDRTLKRRLVKLKEAGVLEGITSPLEQGTRKSFYKLGKVFHQRKYDLDQKASKDKMSLQQGQNVPESKDKMSRNCMVPTVRLNGGEKPATNSEDQEEKTEESVGQVESLRDLFSDEGVAWDVPGAMVEQVTRGQSVERILFAARVFVNDHRQRKRSPAPRFFVNQVAEWMEKSQQAWQEIQDSRKASVVHRCAGECGEAGHFEYEGAEYCRECYRKIIDEDTTPEEQKASDEAMQRLRTLYGGRA